ncbi:protoporphyrinogen/coproporphyrinogen oxidase [Candidatus Avelusimicrobium aviculae]|uniref:protoporphyrinogen/coproporphyrinogen oxidase n=1 Tax=Candidatus Avelusimicrobium aviculae TaxID=3416206 RepID=UPI003D0E126C
MHVRTLILGAGVTGLSTAFHLEHQGDTDYLLIEQDAVPGGLCKSEQREGFTFDQSGHLLHLHDPYALQTFKELLGSNLRRLQRRAVIYTQGVQIPFPFQAHLGYLPPTLRKECLEQAQKAPHIPHPATFKEWCLASFGEGIYTHFLRPYNTKLWGTDPAEMTAEWCSQFIPRPKLQQMQAEAREQKGLGYNAYFYYPLKGGCQALTDALASRVKNLRLNASVTRVDLTARTAWINNEPISFKRLVSTIALPKLLEMTRQPALQSLASRLHCTGINVLNIAAKKPFNAFHWAYFPDEKDPFFRVGVQSSFSPYLAPEGNSSFYIELPSHCPPTPQTQKLVLSRLAQKGIIEEKDVLFSFWQKIPFAYVVYRPQRTPAVAQAQTLLKENGVYLAGRYGRWEYSFIERGFLQGKETAGVLTKDLV